MMQNFFDVLRLVFEFFDNTSILGMSLTTWIIIVLVISIITLFIRGNK